MHFKLTIRELDESSDVYVFTLVIIYKQHSRSLAPSYFSFSHTQLNYETFDPPSSLISRYFSVKILQWFKAV